MVKSSISLALGLLLLFALTGPLSAAETTETPDSGSACKFDNAYGIIAAGANTQLTFQQYANLCAPDPVVLARRTEPQRDQRARTSRSPWPFPSRSKPDTPVVYYRIRTLLVRDDQDDDAHPRGGPRTHQHHGRFPPDRRSRSGLLLLLPQRRGLRRPHPRRRGRLHEDLHQALRELRDTPLRPADRPDHRQGPRRPVVRQHPGHRRVHQIPHDHPGGGRQARQLPRQEPGRRLHAHLRREHAGSTTPGACATSCARAAFTPEAGRPGWPRHGPRSTGFSRPSARASSSTSSSWWTASTPPTTPSTSCAPSPAPDRPKPMTRT